MLFGLVAPAPSFGSEHETASDTIGPFTQDELDANWAPDRQTPSGGFESVSAFGRDDVARVSIDTDEVRTDSDYHLTEGIKSPHGPGDNFDNGGNFGNSVSVDLYIDPTWEDTAVRAGFWAVSDDGDGDINDWWAILEFANLAESTSGSPSLDEFEGFRIWDGASGWTELGTSFSYGEWVTFEIAQDLDEGDWVYSIDGTQVGTASGAEHFIRNVVLNHFNPGTHGFDELDASSYDVHWHHGVLPTPSRSSTQSDEPDEAAGDTITTADGDDVIITVDDSNAIVRHFTHIPVDPDNPPSPAPPSGLSMPFGMFSFDISGIDEGACVDVTIQLPGSAQEYWKLQNGEWFQMDATSDGNRVTMTLCDGGVGDASGEANGYIQDPGAPVVRAAFTG